MKILKDFVIRLRKVILGHKMIRTILTVNHQDDLRDFHKNVFIQ